MYDFHMVDGKPRWDDHKLVAQSIIRDRVARRRLIARMLMLALFLMAAGLWLVNGWLESNKWFFLLWWGACGMVSCGVLLFALFDALAVLREERDKSR